MRTLLIVLLLCGLCLAAATKALDAAPEDSFSVVVIPDTQQYRGHGAKGQPKNDDPVTNVVFERHTKWILDNLSRQRIAFVSHVGDIVDKNEPAQWGVARRCMDRLHGQVPYAIAPGNHDVKASGDSTLFQQYFPASRFTAFPWYGGTYTSSQNGSLSCNNANSYQRFSVCGLDFVFLHLECNAPDDVLRWADGVLQKHADRRAMVTTHMGLGPLEHPHDDRDFFDAPRGRMQWKKVHGERGNTPQQLWDKCFRKHANLFLIFCGDQSRPQAMRLVSRNDAGRPVHELLSDYGGNWLRVNRFLPQQNRIEVYTVDSSNGQLCTGTRNQPDPAQHCFTLDYAMSSTGKSRP